MEIELEQKELTSELGVGSTKLNPLRDIRGSVNPSAYGVSSGSQSVNNASATVVTLGTYTSSQTGMTGTDRLIAPKAGQYLVAANIRFADGATGFRALSTLINNSTQIAQVTELGTSIGQDHYLGVAAVVQLAANDYVQMKFFQTSGGSLTVYNNGTRLSLSLVS